MYIWQLKKFGTVDVPEYKAMLIVSIFACWNIVTAGLLLRALGLIDLNILRLSKPLLILLYLGVAMFLYFAFIYRGKYKIIEEEYKHESLKQRNINSVLILLYMIASFYVNLLI
jgi:hypothetical protein